MTKTRFAAVAMVAALAAVTAGGACHSAQSRWVTPIRFDTATAWFRHDLDSTDLLVEVARSDDQHVIGLSRRPSLDSGSGMLFVFPTVQSAEDGFWMWLTDMPLDVAYIDELGTVRRIIGMELCLGTEESCPSYSPGVEYRSAIEANLGWFEENGIEVGDRVSIVRK